MVAVGAGERVKRPLDPLVWKACAGNSVRVPPAGSLVYYFPQGHAEQASAPPAFSNAARDSSFFLCRLDAVHFLADADTDEVFAVMRLDPRISRLAALRDVSPGVEDGGGDENGVFSFAKVLTPSDANNGGGFSVPRFCADSILPPLNYTEEAPQQMLSLCDAHGVNWEFRHIYRGTPRRHLLTTGWSKFVNSKKLVAGDSVVFIKNRSGELFVGIRRTARSGGNINFQEYVAQPEAEHGGDVGRVEGFSRNCRGRVTPAAVAEAARLAEVGLPFEVEYYPKVRSADYVVKKETVEAAIALPWSVGTRVKMAMESEGSSRTASYQGDISCILQHPPPFSCSLWRTLEVSWDEPESSKGLKRVSPWELVLVPPSSPIMPPYPPLKRARIRIVPEHNALFPVPKISNVVESINASMFVNDIFPAGMQGARHDPTYASSISNFLKFGIQPTQAEKVNINNSPKNGYVSTGVVIGCASTSKSLSPPSQNGGYYDGSDKFSHSEVKKTSKVSNGSFQLFGTTIHIGRPVVADVEENCNEDIVPGRPFTISLSYSQNEFHD